VVTLTLDTDHATHKKPAVQGLKKGIITFIKYVKRNRHNYNHRAYNQITWIKIHVIEPYAAQKNWSFQIGYQHLTMVVQRVGTKHYNPTNGCWHGKKLIGIIRETLHRMISHMG